MTMVSVSTHLKCEMVRTTVLTSQLREIVVGLIFSCFLAYSTGLSFASKSQLTLKT